MCPHIQKHTNALGVKSPTVLLLPESVLGCIPMHTAQPSGLVSLCCPWGHLLAARTGPSSQVRLGAGAAALFAVEPVAAHTMLRYQVTPVEEVFAGHV